MGCHAKAHSVEPWAYLFETVPWAFYHHVPWPRSSYSYAKVHAVTKMAICSKLAGAATTKIDLSAK